MAELRSVKSPFWPTLVDKIQRNSQKATDDILRALFIVIPVVWRLVCAWEYLEKSLKFSTVQIC